MEQVEAGEPRAMVGAAGFEPLHGVFRDVQQAGAFGGRSGAAGLFHLVKPDVDLGRAHIERLVLC